jgi:hypothetical protein
MQNLQEPFAPARAVLGKLAFALGIALALERPSNQSMKPMAPTRYFATLLATNPAHGLSLSR